MNANPTYQEWELLVRCWKLGAACLALIVAILSMQLGRTWADLVKARASSDRALTLAGVEP